VNTCIYLVALDPPNSMYQWRLAKYAISSLYRCGFNGKVLVFRSSPVPLFPFSRAGLTEFHVEQDQFECTSPAFFQEACRARFNVVPSVLDYDFDRILYIDTDHIFTRIPSFLDEHNNLAYATTRNWKFRSSGLKTYHPCAFSFTKGDFEKIIYFWRLFDQIAVTEPYYDWSIWSYNKALVQNGSPAISEFQLLDYAPFDFGPLYNKRHLPACCRLGLHDTDSPPLLASEDPLNDLAPLMTKATYAAQAWSNIWLTQNNGSFIDRFES
jgi:hypothetical protein